MPRAIPFARTQGSRFRPGTAEPPQTPLSPPLYSTSHTLHSHHNAHPGHTKLMDVQERISRFENMTQADPSNDMAWFSLGSAYTQAGRHADAAKAYIACIDLNKDFSKAYQLAGSSLIAAGDKSMATDVLTKGYTVAASKGDLMPKDAMADLLRSLGAEVPEVKGPNTPGSADGASPGTRGFVCKRTGRPGSKLTEAPMRGPMGQWIVENISAETWKAWIGQGTKVINELRLDFSKDKDQETYDRHMREYLGIDDELLAKLQAEEHSNA